MKQPNILFVFPDQHRPDWLGTNAKLPLRTPNLDRLSANGVSFSNAFTPSPLCSPARACLATGRDYERCGVRHNGDNTPVSLPTYYRHLRDAGYEVAGVGKFDLHKPDLDWGLDGSNMLDEYGFTCGIDNEGKGDAIVAYRDNGMLPRGPYMQFLKEAGLDKTHYAMYEPHMSGRGWLNFATVTDLPDHAYCDNWVAANAMRYLENFQADKPWHLVVNFVGPHGPFDVTSDMRSKWESVDIPPPVDNDEPDVETIKDRRRNYAAMIENIDSHLGAMIEMVDRRGELDNTLIVYASDHGEMLGDHSRWGKSLWYTPSAGIPIIASGPRVQHGVRSEAMVSLHDLAATFLEFAGTPALPDSDAISLRDLLHGKTNQHRDHVLSGLNKWRMVFDGRYKLVTEFESSPILYDLDEDPHELENIANRQPEIVERLERHITS